MNIRVDPSLSVPVFQHDKSRIIAPRWNKIVRLRVYKV